MSYFPALASPGAVENVLENGISTATSTHARMDRPAHDIGRLRQTLQRCSASSYGAEHICRSRGDAEQLHGSIRHDQTAPVLAATVDPPASSHSHRFMPTSRSGTLCAHETTWIPSYGVGPNNTLAHAAGDSKEICGSIRVSLSQTVTHPHKKVLPGLQARARFAGTSAALEHRDRRAFNGALELFAATVWAPGMRHS